MTRVGATKSCSGDSSIDETCICMCDCHAGCMITSWRGGRDGVCLLRTTSSLSFKLDCALAGEYMSFMRLNSQLSITTHFLPIVHVVLNWWPCTSIGGHVIISIGCFFVFEIQNITPDAERKKLVKVYSQRLEFVQHHEGQTHLQDHQ